MNHDESDLLRRENNLRHWFTFGSDPVRAVVDALDIGWGGVQRWATSRIPPPGEHPHLDLACGYATFLAQLGWRFRSARLLGLNIDFEGANALAKPLLKQAGVPAQLVAADARSIPLADRSVGSVSCFMGLQDIEIAFGQEGVLQTLREAVRVVRTGGTLSLLDEYSFEELEALCRGLPVNVIGQGECELDVRWNREIGERAITLYAEGWIAQRRVGAPDSSDTERVRYLKHLEGEMDRQLSERGYYVPFGPVRMVSCRKTASS
jgi:SAM-dependent methyltransferase